MDEALREFIEILQQHCFRTKEVTVHYADVSGHVDYVYQVRLRDRRRGDDLMNELRSVEGIGDVSLVLRDELGEM